MSPLGPLSPHLHFHLCSGSDAGARGQRFARADKRAKLPRWINQYITETAANLSTDMALSLSKLFMRTISQNAGENLTGVSLWTLEDVHKAQAAQREAAAEAEAARLAMEQAAAEAEGGGMMDVDEDEDEEADEYGDGGFSDRMLRDAGTVDG